MIEGSGRWRRVLGWTGRIWVIAGVSLASPLLALPWYLDELALAPALLLPAALLFGLGALAWWVGRVRGVALSHAEAATAITLGWLGACFGAGLCFMLGLELELARAMFESTSGWTTTGLSVVDVEHAPRTMLLLRSVIEYVGGAGLAIIVLAAVAGPPGAGLSVAEGRSDLLVPHVRHSARVVMALYSGYLVLGCVAYRLAGMDEFDAINHAMAAVSTGGFSTRAASIGAWDSPAIEAVTIVLMLLGCSNFVTIWALVRRRRTIALHSPEWRTMAVVLLLASATMLLAVTPSLYAGVDRQLRVALFETVSALSTTGFSSVTYGDWPPLGFAVMIPLMIIGGGAGSTSGGLKQLRVYMLARAALDDLERRLRPARAVSETRIVIGDRVSSLSDADMREVSVFTSLYMLCMLLGTASLCAYGYSLRDAAFEYASALGTVGLSIGVTSPDTPAGALWSMTIGMFLGRLEIHAVLVAGMLMLGDLGRFARRAPGARLRAALMRS